MGCGFDDLDLFPTLYDLYDLYDLAHVVGWEPCELRDLSTRRRGRFLGLICAAHAGRPCVTSENGG